MLCHQILLFKESKFSFNISSFLQNGPVNNRLVTVKDCSQPKYFTDATDTKPIMVSITKIIIVSPPQLKLKKTIIMFILWFTKLYCNCELTYSINM